MSVADLALLRRSAAGRASRAFRTNGPRALRRRMMSYATLMAHVELGLNNDLLLATTASLAERLSAPADARRRCEQPDHDIPSSRQNPKIIG